MKFCRSIIPALALIFTLSSRADVATISPEKRAEINKLLRLTGREKLANQMKDQMLANMKNDIHGQPPEFWEKMAARLDVRQLIEKTVPIYDKYYSLEDLRAINAFYSSPAGQKILSVSPQVMKESIAVGKEWGEKIGQQVDDEMSANQKKNKAK